MRRIPLLKIKRVLFKFDHIISIFIPEVLRHFILIDIVLPLRVGNKKLLMKAEVKT